MAAAALVVVSGVAIAREMEVADAAAALKSDLLLIERGKVPAANPVVDTSAPSRAVLIDALRLARDAAVTPDPDRRRRLLDTAAAAVGTAAAARPAWGDAAIADAYVVAQQTGADSAPALAALARSYREAPYMLSAAGWRVGTGIAAWPRLSAPTRDAVIDEAVWLSASSYAAQVAVLDLMRRSPAYQPFLLRWRAYRLRDR